MERGFGRAPPVTGRSLYLLGPGNGIRRAIHRFVHCKPFEVVVMACILANTVVMMLQDPSSLSSDVLDLNSTLATLDFIFLCVFTGEAILRIVALGFAIGPNTYLRDVWNRLDFIAVLSSWVTVLPGSIPRFTALRAPRGLKALRSVRFFTEIRAILRSLSFSVSLILNALTIMGFFFLMLSISSVEAFHRSMRRRCVYNGTLVSEPALSLPQRWCSRGELGGSSCPSYQECSGAVGNQYSHINFDNVLSAALALFEDGWVRDIMNPLMDAEYRFSAVYWVVVVALLVFLILNLFVAVVTTSFARVREDPNKDSAFSADFSAGWTNTVSSVKSSGSALERPFGSLLIKPADTTAEEAAEPAAPTSRRRGWRCCGARVLPEVAASPPSTSPRSSGKDPADSGLKGAKPVTPADATSGADAAPAPQPGRFTAFRRWLLEAVLDWKFEAAVTVLILANTAFLSMEYHGMPEDYAQMLQTSELVFTTAFALEMLVKVLAYGGPRPYLRVPVNVFDATIVVLTSLDLILRVTSVSTQGDARVTLNVSAVRAFRISRLLLKVKSLRQLIHAVLGSMRGVFNLLVFMFFVVAVASIMAMQLFGGELPPVSADGSSPPRANFDTYGASFLTMFQVLTGDQWTVVLADAVRTPSGAWIAPPFFILYFMISNYIILNLFIAVVLENFELSEQAKMRLQRKRAEEVAEDLSLLGSASHDLKSAFWVRAENSGSRVGGSRIGGQSRKSPRTSVRSGSGSGRIKGSVGPTPPSTPSVASKTHPLAAFAAEEKGAGKDGASALPPAAVSDRYSSSGTTSSLARCVSAAQPPPPLPPPQVNAYGAPSSPRAIEVGAGAASPQGGPPQLVLSALGPAALAAPLRTTSEPITAAGAAQGDRCATLGALPTVPRAVDAATLSAQQLGSSGGDAGSGRLAGRPATHRSRVARQAANITPLLQRPTSAMGPPTAQRSSRATPPLHPRGGGGDEGVSGQLSAGYQAPNGAGGRESPPADSPVKDSERPQTGTRTSTTGARLLSMPSTFFEDADIEPPPPPVKGGRYVRQSWQRRGGGQAAWNPWGRTTSAVAVHARRRAGAQGRGGAVVPVRERSSQALARIREEKRPSGSRDVEEGHPTDARVQSAPALGPGERGDKQGAAHKEEEGEEDAAEEDGELETTEGEDEDEDDEEYGRSWCCRLRVSNPVRRMCIRVVESRWFDRVVLVVILSSCVALALEQPHHYLLSDGQLRVQEALEYSSAVFFVLFFVEFLLRVTAQGFWWAPAPYWADPFNRLDLFVLVVSGLDLLTRMLEVGVGPAASVSRALRVGRVLRPLRLVNKNAGMRVIVDALLKSIPAAFNVLLLSLLFFFIFGIIGVNLFSGVFYSCNDPGVQTRAECVGIFVNAVGLPTPRAWSNFASSFNHIGSAIITLMEVTSLNWIDTARVAMDARGVDLQRQRNAAPASAIFFILFVVVGAFFMVNLFVGVMVEQFRANDGTAILTPQQKHWVELERLMAQFEPDAERDPPTHGSAYYAHRITTHRLFEPIVFFAIFLNVLLMLSFTADSSRTWLHVLSISNLIFLGVYSVEAILKITAQRAAYFRDSWNVFDFVCVAPAWVVLALPPGFNFGTQVMRIFRVLRVARFARRSAGVRSLLRTMRISAPSLANLGFLLFLVMFVFAIVGQQMFGGVKYGSMLNRSANFRSIGPSLLNLFQMLAGDNWHTIMRNSQLKEPFCTVMPDTGTLPAGSDCGSILALAFYPWFYIVVVFVFINLFVSLVLENFSSSYVPPEDAVDGQSRHSVTMADFDSYKAVWAKYDPRGVGAFPIHRLRSFLDELEGSLRIPASDRFSYLMVRVQVERAFRPARRLRRTSAFNELLYVLCLYHMGVTSLPFSQQRKRALWMLESRNAVAEMLIGGVVHGCMVRWRMSKDLKYKHLSKLKRRAVSQLASDLHVRRSLQATAGGHPGASSTGGSASTSTAT